MFIVENRGSPIVDAYEKTIRASEIAPGTMKTVKLINGEKVLVVNTEGKFRGMGAICGHFEWDLSDGRVQGKKVVCAGHGAIWDLETGKAQFDEPTTDEPLYDVAEEGGFLWVRKRAAEAVASQKDDTRQQAV